LYDYTLFQAINSSYLVQSDPVDIIILHVEMQVV